MMSVELPSLPSLPSADLRNMMAYMNMPVPPPRREGRDRRWTDALRKSVECQDDYEADRSPSPRTPSFGDSSVPFSESNAQFGFSFSAPPQSTATNPALVSTAVAMVTGTFTTVSSEMPGVASGQEPRPHSDSQNSSSSSETSAGRTVGGEMDPETNAHRETIQVNTQGAEAYITRMSNWTQRLQNTESVSDANIPNILFDEDIRNHTGTPVTPPSTSYSSSSSSPVASSPHAPPDTSTPYIEAAGVLPVGQYKLVELDTSQQQGMAVYAQYNLQQGMHPVIADIDTIQRLEEQPMFVDSSQDQATSSSSDYTDYDPNSSDDAYSIMDVGANQQVATEDYIELKPFPADSVPSEQDEAPTYIELKTRPLTTISTHSIDSHIVPDLANFHSEHEQTTRNMAAEKERATMELRAVRKSLESSDPDMASAVGKSLEEQSASPLLKNVLKTKIQLRRLERGEDELRVSFEHRPVGQLTEEERMKAETRKQKNRESAVRSRTRRQKHMAKLEQEVKELDRENKRIEKDIAQLRETRHYYMSCFQACDHIASQQVQQTTGGTFAQVLTTFLASKTNT